jgi:heme A synthase
MKRPGRLWNQEVMLAGVLIGQIGLGILNVLLLATVWLQLVRLLVAELFWVLVVLASANPLFATFDCNSVARTSSDFMPTPSRALRSDLL